MPHALPLTRGQVALVDDTDLPLVSTYSWRYSSNGYAVTTIRKDGRRQALYLHRFLLDAPPHLQVDHIDRNPLNCTRRNLRLATLSQNQHNRRQPSNTRTGFKGVTYRRGRYHARIRVDGRNVHLGYHETAEIAARVYDAAARRFHGEFAYLNFPAEDTPKQVEVLLDQLLGEAPSPASEPIERRASRYRGVYWERRRWRAKLTHRGKTLHLGYFTSEVDAARAYDRAARIYHGDQARLNFPDDNAESPLTVSEAPDVHFGKKKDVTNDTLTRRGQELLLTVS